MIKNISIAFGLSHLVELVVINQINHRNYLLNKTFSS